MAGKQRWVEEGTDTFFIWAGPPICGPTAFVSGAWKQRQSSEWEPQPVPAAQLGAGLLEKGSSGYFGVS